MKVSVIAIAIAIATSGVVWCDESANEASACRQVTVDFIVNEGDATARAIEDDVVSDLAKLGISVNTRLLNKDDLNKAMVDGDFNLAFSETWGSPYDPQAFASSWGTPDEAYHVALDGLKEPYTKDVLLGKISDVLTMESEAEREEAWTEILKAMHEQATELPFSGKRIPAAVSRRLTGYAPGHQQFDYPVHSIRVLSGPKTVTVSPGAQTGLFSNETGVGRLDPHSYRPNEFFANNWVYDGLVEYGAGGAIVPALAETWAISDRQDGQPGQEYAFKLRQGVKFHDGADWNCSVAKLNFDHVLAMPLVGPDYHGWYATPDMIDSWGCEDDSTFVITTKDKYYPLLQELSFIRPLRMLSPNLFMGGLESDPLTQNSCPEAWGNVTEVTEAGNVTVQCAGMVGGGVSAGGQAAGTGRWKYLKTEKDGDAIRAVHFGVNGDHWDAPSGSHAEEIVVVAYPDDASVKSALLSGELDAVLGSGVLTEADIDDIRMNHGDDVHVSMTEPIQNRIIVMNTGRAPTDDLTTRKVIIHGVDKANIIKKELAGLDEPAMSLFPKDTPYTGAHLTPMPDYDIEKARLLNCPV